MSLPENIHPIHNELTNEQLWDLVNEMHLGDPRCQLDHGTAVLKNDQEDKLNAVPAGTAGTVTGSLHRESNQEDIYLVRFASNPEHETLVSGTKLTRA